MGTVNFEWTDEAIEQLRKMRDEKMSFRSIAEVLGVSRNAAIGKAHRLGIWTEKSAKQPMAAKPVRVKREKPAFVPPAPKVRQVPEKPLPVVVPVVVEAEADPEGVALLDLSHFHCRWPLGPVRAVATHFCGRMKRDGSPYCDDHHRLSYRPFPGTLVPIRERRKTGLGLRSEVGRI